MSTTSRIACILVPELVIDADSGDPNTPRTVHRGKGNQARITHCNRAASERRILPGQTLAAARARVSDLHSTAYDARAIARRRQAVLARLATHSPRVRPDRLHRFWAEPAPLKSTPLPRWCQLIRSALQHLGPVGIGVGSNATLAYAAAVHAKDGVHILAPSYEESFLDAAPLAVLELDEETLDTLAALGILRVGDLRKLDPVELGIRFGPEAARARRRIDGDDPRGPSTPQPTTTHQVQVDLDDELDNTNALAFLLKPAIDQLLAGLSVQAMGALMTELTLRLRGEPPHNVQVRTAEPINDSRALLELLRTALERTELAAPLTGFCLRAAETGPSSGQVRDLFGQHERDPAAREVVLERMRSRFGQRAVRRASRVEVGTPIDRAQWLCSGPPVHGQALPWRRIIEPTELRKDRIELAGQLRKLRHMGRVERANLPWWIDGNWQVDRYAWAELEGPVLVLLQALAKDGWRAVAWMD